MTQNIQEPLAYLKALVVVLSLVIGFSSESIAQSHQTPLVIEIDGLTVDQHAQIYKAFAGHNDFELFRSCVPTGLLLFHTHLSFTPGTTSFFEGVESIIISKVANIGAVRATTLSGEAFEQRCRQSRGGN